MTQADKIELQVEISKVLERYCAYGSPPDSGQMASDVIALLLDKGIINDEE